MEETVLKVMLILDKTNYVQLTTQQGAFINTHTNDYVNDKRKQILSYLTKLRQMTNVFIISIKKKLVSVLKTQLFTKDKCLLHFSIKRKKEIRRNEKHSTFNSKRKHKRINY